MNLETLYLDTIAKLTRGERVFLHLTKQDCELLASQLTVNENLSKQLCLIAHLKEPSEIFISPLIQLAKNSSLTANQLVLTMECLRKHLINGSHKRGQRLESPHLAIIQSLLLHKNYEVVEWALRLIDELGGQGLYFKEAIQEIKPKGFFITNKHKKNILQIITMLEKRWGGI
jgi:hypothetical protein